MNTTTDVASSPASNELVTVLGRSVVLDGETLIVDSLVVYKNGTGSPEAIEVATPFLSGTNVRPGRVNPTKSLYDPSTGTYHFEIPVTVDLNKNMDYTFDFMITVDGVSQQVRSSWTTPEAPEYTMKAVSTEFEGDKLVVGFDITSRDGKDILVASTKPTTLVGLTNRTGNGPEVVQKGNRVFLKWNASIDNSAAQIFIASGLLNVGTSTTGYSIAFETKPVSIESSEIVVSEKELELTFNLSAGCEGPFSVANIGLKENGKVVKAIASVPQVVGKQVKVRLVRTVPTRNKIEYTVTGGIVLGGNANRTVPFEFEVTDFIKADLPPSPRIEVENISHTYVNGIEKAVFRLTLNNSEHTPLINIDGLRLEAPADSSTRNTVDYNPATGELTVLRSVSTATGILTTRGRILAYDYSDTIIEGEFHSSIGIETDIYRPGRCANAQVNTIVYSGGDTDVGISIPVMMANGEIPQSARVSAVIAATNLDTLNLTNRYSYNGGQLSFQLSGTRLSEMAGKVYNLSVLVDIDTPNGVSSVPVFIEHAPELSKGKPELVLSSVTTSDREAVLNFKLNNAPANADLYVTNIGIDGFQQVVVNYNNARQTLTVEADVSDLPETFPYSGTVKLQDQNTGSSYELTVPASTFAPAATLTPLSSHYTNGNIEVQWACRDAIGLIPEDVVINKHSWVTSVNLGGAVSIHSYDKTTGVLTQVFRAIDGNVDVDLDISVKFQFPMPDANVYSVETHFEHKKSDKATRAITMTQDGVVVNIEERTATIFFGIDIPPGIAYQDLRIAGLIHRNDVVSGGIISHGFTNNSLNVTVGLNPARVLGDFVADIRVDVIGPNVRGQADVCFSNDLPVDRFTIVGSGYHKEGFIRFYGKAPRTDVARLGHIVKSVSNDVTNYPPSVKVDLNSGMILIDYPVKSNEFVGRTYAVEGIIDLGDVQEHYKAYRTLKAIKPMYNNFILTQGGSVVDYKQGVMKINFSIEAFGMAGVGVPQETGIKVVSADGQFKSDEEVVYELDPITGKGFYIVKIHDRSTVRHPNAELKVIISSPNVGNNYNGTITGFSGQENTCEIITTRFIPNKGEIVFRAGVGYGYPTATRPTMVNFMGGVQLCEGIESGTQPTDVSYDKNTGILEFRVKGNARPIGDVLYSGKAVLGVIDGKGKSSNITLDIHTVVRDSNEARLLTAEVVDIKTFEGRSQFNVQLGYADYLYPPEAPVITCSAPNVSIEYDKVKGLAQVTIAGDIYSYAPSSVSGVLFVTDSLSNVNVSGEPENVMTRIPLSDSNGPEGIHQLSQQWTPHGLVFTLTARIQGKKPSYTSLVDNFKGVGFNIDSPKIEYDEKSGLIHVYVDASKPKFTALSIRGKLTIALNDVLHQVVVDTGIVYPEGITHIVSCGYNKEIGRVFATWVVYGKDGKHPAKVNLNTGTLWENTQNLNTGRPTKEQYDPNSGVYYVEFAPAQRVLGQRVYKASTILTTGKENIPVQFTVSF